MVSMQSKKQRNQRLSRARCSLSRPCTRLRPLSRVEGSPGRGLETTYEHIYALLAGLERDGLVRHERVDQETRPAKKVFSITDEGRLVFLVWVRSPVTSVRDIRLEFLAKLYFSRFDSPTALDDLVSNQLTVCRSNMKRLSNSRRLCKTDTERAALDYRLAMLNAVEAWLLGLCEPHMSLATDLKGRSICNWWRFWRVGLEPSRSAAAARTSMRRTREEMETRRCLRCRQ